MVMTAPPATTDAPEEAPTKTYRMKLLDTQFLSEFEGLGGPRLPAGSVLDVDTDTAVRWLGRGIAVYAKKGAATLKDARRARLLARLEALEAEDDADAEDAPALAVQPTAQIRRGRPPGRRVYPPAQGQTRPAGRTKAAVEPIETDDSADAGESDSE